MNFRGLWVDDERPIPADLVEQGWCKAVNFHEAIVKLELIQFEEISLDHDIASFYGNKEMTGYDILLWLVQRKFDGKFIPPKIHIHTANPVGRNNLVSVMDRYLPEHKV